MSEPIELLPDAVKIEPVISDNWDYDESVKKVQESFISWTTISESLIRELYIAKMAITDWGRRTCGATKKGKTSWGKYVSEALGGKIGKKSVDSYIEKYVNNGFRKPTYLTINPITDLSKVYSANAVRLDDGRIAVDIVEAQGGSVYPQKFKAK